MEAGSVSEDFPLDALGGYLCRYPPCVDTRMWLLTNVRRTDNKNLFICHQLIRFFGAVKLKVLLMKPGTRVYSLTW